MGDENELDEEIVDIEREEVDYDDELPDELDFSHNYDDY